MLSRNKDRQRFLEADWRKLYINDLVTLLKLPVQITGLLYELAKSIDFHGLVSLENNFKKEIARKLQISNETLDDYLAILIEQEIVKRADRETLKLNAYFFNPGQWQELERCRHKSNLKLQLQVTYLNNGHKKIELVSSNEIE